MVWLPGAILAAGLSAWNLGASTPGEARFPHEFHFDDLELECGVCHHETAAAKLDIPHQEYFVDFWIRCAICHKDSPVPGEAQSCTECHHDSPTDVADETLSTKVVVHKSCWTCHEVGTGPSASRACKSCHEQEE